MKLLIDYHRSDARVPIRIFAARRPGGILGQQSANIEAVLLSPIEHADLMKELAGAYQQPYRLSDYRTTDADGRLIGASPERALDSGQTHWVGIESSQVASSAVQKAANALRHRQECPFDALQGRRGDCYAWRFPSGHGSAWVIGETAEEAVSKLGTAPEGAVLLKNGRLID